jgi:hypothetical protein
MLDFPGLGSGAGFTQKRDPEAFRMFLELANLSASRLAVKYLFRPLWLQTMIRAA